MKRSTKPKALWVQIRDAGVQPVQIKRRRIRSLSASMQARLKRYAYREAKASFLAVRERCERCQRLGICGPLDLHHKRGRAGSLLTDARYFAALCRECHRWVHEHPDKAREQGWLGQWGKSE